MRIALIKDILKQEETLFLTPNVSLETGCDNMDLDNIKKTLHDNRGVDARKGRTNFGPHKTEFIATHPIKQRSAAQCSTGEQKAMLVSLILAQAKGIKHHCEHAPIVLLDEIFTHLDKSVEKNLLNALQGFAAQTWITATEYDNHMDGETVIKLK